MAAVLVTGSTGVLGSYVVKRLLETTDHIIFCPVRASNLGEAEGRIQGSLHAYGVVDATLSERVKCIVADIASPDFLDVIVGTPGTQSVQKVFHCGAITNLFARPEVVNRVNVHGTLQLARFCLRAPERLFCFVSSYAAFGDALMRAGTVLTEDDLEVGQGFPRMYYHASKYCAERQLRSDEFSDLRYVVMRSGNIFGESSTGNLLRRSETPSMLFYDAVKTGVEELVAFESTFLFDVSPVDFVADAILGLADQRFTGRTFHLLNPSPISFGNLARVLIECGYPIEVVRFEKFKQKVLAARQSVDDRLSYALKALRFMLLANPNLDLSFGAVVSTQETVEILKEVRVERPQQARDLIRYYVDVDTTRGLLAPSPGKQR